MIAPVFHNPVKIENSVLASDRFLVSLSGSWVAAGGMYRRGFHMRMLMADGLALAKVASERMARFKKAYPRG